MGPPGPAGHDGASGVVRIKSGVLLASDFRQSVGGWDISVAWLNDSMIVQAYARQGSGEMWQPCLFYASAQFQYVRIIDNESADPQDEYKIITISAK